MKKFTILVLTLLVSISLTGCVNNENEKSEQDNDMLKSIPKHLQGLYQGDLYSDTILKLYFVYKIEGTTVKQKICTIDNKSGVNETITDCDFEDGKTGLFETYVYTIKDIKKYDYDKDVVDFNMYDGDELYAKCSTEFGGASCTTNDGNYLSWSKEA